MSKRKKAAAAQRRQEQKRRPLRGNKRNQGWFFIGGVLVLLVIVVAVFLVMGRQNQPPATGIAAGTPVNASTLQQVMHIDSTLLSQIGAGKATGTFQTPKDNPAPLVGPTGKPEVLYVGGEYCPYCAAERWPLIIALSRFGTFHNLKNMTSISSDVYPSTPTFSFYQSSYTSQYIDFVPVETADQQGQPLQKLSSSQQNIFNTYDSPPYVDAQGAQGIPFLDFGNRFIADGLNYDPGVLRTDTKNPYSQALPEDTILHQLASDNTLSESVLGSANYYTAVICSLIKNPPASVANDPAIQQIERSLPGGSVAHARPFPASEGPLKEGINYVR